MRILDSLIATASARALGAALAHFVWQGALAALLLGAALWCFRQSARMRYRAACLALLVLPVAFGVTFWIALHTAAPAATVTLGRLPARVPVPLPAIGRSLPAPSPEPWTARLPWLTPFWLAGVSLLYARTLVSWAAAQRLRRAGVCAAPAAWQLRLDRLKRRLRISGPVLLLESCLTEAPVVIGFFRPVILMPLGLLSGFPAEHVEAFLIHELAHIRRFDYLVNLAQSLVEGLLFYHPAVWWISSVVRAERENCCDDAVVALTGDAHGYATALTELEERRWTAADAAVAATGGNLMKRIHRLLGLRQPVVVAGPVVGLLLVSACLALATWAPRPAAPARIPQVVSVPHAPQAPLNSAELKREPARLIAQANPPAASTPAPPADRPASDGQAAVMPFDRLQRFTQNSLPTPEQRAAAASETNRRMFAQAFQAAQAQPPAAGQTPSDRASQEQRLRQELETPYTKWLQEDVVYIISDEERNAFRRLQTDPEREQFIEQFWLRRDPTPGTPQNEYKEEHYRRIAYAKRNFGFSETPGWKTDRGRIYISFGPPDERDEHPTGGTYERPPSEGGGKTTVFPFETWRYRHIEGIGNDVNMEFVDTARTGEYRMTMDPSEKDALKNSPGNQLPPPPAQFLRLKGLTGPAPK